MRLQGAENKPVRLSLRLYQRLLVAYPKRHRLDYGPAMLQLFRDQCRDAWHGARWYGVLRLWLRVVPDIVTTSFSEHIANLTGAKYMVKKLFSSARSSAALSFFVTLVVVFAAVLLSAVIITFIMPEAYSSRARILVERNMTNGVAVKEQALAGHTYDPYLFQTEFEVIKSELILDPVIEQLDLNESWRKKYNAETKFKTSDIREALKGMIELSPTRNTSLIDITVYSNDRIEAANIANAVAEEYQIKRGLPTRESSGATSINPLKVEIIEHAEPPFRPVRPNKPLNIFIGIVIGTALGSFAGGIIALIVYKTNDRRPKILPAILPS